MSRRIISYINDFGSECSKNRARKDIDCWCELFNVETLEIDYLRVCDEKFGGVEKDTVKRLIRKIAFDYKELAGTPF